MMHYFTLIQFYLQILSSIGPPGLIGPVGLKGNQGPLGSPGIDGFSGRDGEKGDRGFNGKERYHHHIHSITFLKCFSMLTKSPNLSF